MRIALLSDIRAAACLAHVERTGVGDYVEYGADPGCVINTVSTFVKRGAVAITMLPSRPVGRGSPVGGTGQTVERLEGIPDLHAVIVQAGIVRAEMAV